MNDRHQGRSVAAAHPAGHLAVHDVPRRGRRPAGARLPGGVDDAEVPLSAIDDLHAWLREQGDWVRSAPPTSRRRPRTEPSRRGAGRPDNPVGGWYGLRKGYRGRFGMYLPPLLEELGLAELTHEKRNNRIRASDERAA